MYELKDCPFCGEKPHFHRYVERIEDENSLKVMYCDYVRVRCGGCGACSKSIMYIPYKHDDDSDYKEAAAAWNKRATPEQIAFKNAFLVFIKRKQIAKLYKNWIGNTGFKDSPENVIAYLASHGLLTADKLSDILREGNKND